MLHRREAAHTLLITKSEYLKQWFPTVVLYSGVPRADAFFNMSRIHFQNVIKAQSTLPLVRVRQVIFLFFTVPQA